jgi:hypothetical protein
MGATSWEAKNALDWLHLRSWLDEVKCNNSAGTALEETFGVIQTPETLFSIPGVVLLKICQITSRCPK